MFLDELLPRRDGEPRNVHLARTFAQAHLAVEAGIHDLLERLLGERIAREIAPDHLHEQNRLGPRGVRLERRGRAHGAIVAARPAAVAHLDHVAVLGLVEHGAGLDVGVRVPGESLREGAGVRDHVARIQDSGGIHGVLHPRHDGVRLRILPLEVGCAQDAVSVLARDRAAQAPCELERILRHGGHAALEGAIVRIQERHHMDVSVPRVPEDRESRAVLLEHGAQTVHVIAQALGGHRGVVDEVHRFLDG